MTSLNHTHALTYRPIYADYPFSQYINPILRPLNVLHLDGACARAVTSTHATCTPTPNLTCCTLLPAICSHIGTKPGLKDARRGARQVDCSHGSRVYYDLQLRVWTSKNPRHKKTYTRETKETERESMRERGTWKENWEDERSL